MSLRWHGAGALLLGALLAVALVAAGRAQTMGGERFERSSLIVETAAGRQHRFDVELAVTDRQHAQGLMFRRSLPADAGMLFVYAAEQEILMWMKNTVIPLDMIFADAAGRVVSIAERTVPQSREVISSRRPAKYVLEVNGGTADRLGIAPGDYLRHRLIGGPGGN